MLGLGMGLHKHKQKQIVRNGLVLYLDGKDFKNSPPTTSWDDRSGLGNNATPSGMAYTTSSGADGVGGVVFDGVDDTMNFNSPLDFNEITVELVFKLLVNNTVDNSGLVGNASYQNYGWQIGFPFSDNRIGVACNGTLTETKLDPSYTLLVDTYYSIVLKYSLSSNLLSIYSEGVLLASRTPSAPKAISSTNLLLGKSTQWAFRNNQSTKSLKVYNRALTDSEIRQNYNASR